MNRRPILAALAAGALAVTGTLASSTSASAATLEGCTISTPVGNVRVTFFTHKNSTLGKTGFVQIFGARQPVQLRTDRVGWQRGASGMVLPRSVRQWQVSYPVTWYTHARVVVKTSGGTFGGCSTR